MLTQLKSAVCILHMLRHINLGHVTLLRREFQLPKFSPNRTSVPGTLAMGFA